MIVKVITYIIGGALAIGFLWFTAKVVIIGLKATLSPNKTRKGKK